MRKLSFVYIAGPYRAKGGGHDATVYLEIDRNIAKAREAAAFLAQNLVPFFCPHLNSCHFEVIAPNTPPQYWYDLDMEILEHASAIWLIDGWENSGGALAERDRANELGIINWMPNSGVELVDWWKKNERGAEYLAIRA